MQSPHPAQCLAYVPGAHSALYSALPSLQPLGNSVHTSGCNCSIRLRLLNPHSQAWSLPCSTLPAQTPAIEKGNNGTHHPLPSQSCAPSHVQRPTSPQSSKPEIRESFGDPPLLLHSSGPTDSLSLPRVHPLPLPKARTFDERVLPSWGHFGNQRAFLDCCYYFCVSKRESDDPFHLSK